MTPSTQVAQHVCKLFNRRLTTHWSPKEIKQYKRLVKDMYLTNVDEIELIERYYAYQRQKGDAGIHRRDLYTFLNNYSGELDRANAWNVRNKRPKPKVNTQNGQRTNDEDWQRIGDLAREQLAAFRKQLSHE